MAQESEVGLRPLQSHMRSCSTPAINITNSVETKDNNDNTIKTKSSRIPRHGHLRSQRKNLGKSSLSHTHLNTSRSFIPSPTPTRRRMSQQTGLANREVDPDISVPNIRGKMPSMSLAVSGDSPTRSPIPPRKLSLQAPESYEHQR